MKSNNNKFLFLLIFLFSLVATNANAACQEKKFFNPVTDTNWNNLFPMKFLSGVEINLGNNSSPPLHHMPAVCSCPGHFGAITPGVGITYWEPVFISEVAMEPSCLITLGGIKFSRSYDLQKGTTTDDPKKDHSAQIHWYEYPIFKMLDWFADIACASIGNTGLSIGYMSEFDPSWGTSLWASVLSPEAILFANPIMDAACAVDSLSAVSRHQTLDAMFWCGSSGSIYPFSGVTGSMEIGDSNMTMTQKIISKLHRTFQLFGTIGPHHQCLAFPTGMVIKSQYRFNPIYPFPVTSGKPIVWSSRVLSWGMPKPANPPSKESSAHLIFRARQCCLNP